MLGGTLNRIFDKYICESIPIVFSRECIMKFDRFR